MLFNTFSLALLSASAASAASALTLRQRRPDDRVLGWNEAAQDFKAIIKAITFGEGFPSHHESPLQMITEPEQPQMELFILAAEGSSPSLRPQGSMMNGFRPGKSQNPHIAQKKKTGPKKSWMAKAKRASRSQSAALSQEDLLLLNFLAAQEEPSPRVQADLKKANQRYQSIISERKKLKNSKKAKKMNSKPSKLIKPSKQAKPSSKQTKPKSKQPKQGKSFLSRLDLKGARNKLTISVAFAVIVTALFCVVVQLFRLFSRPSQRGFDQINRRSAVGYERIALDVDEEDEAMPLNNA